MIASLYTELMSSRNSHPHLQTTPRRLKEENREDPSTSLRIELKKV